jgi:hypothetical protein
LTICLQARRIHLSCSQLHRDWRNDIEGLGTLFSNHLPAYRNLITSDAARARN